MLNGRIHSLRRTLIAHEIINDCVTLVSGEGLYNKNGKRKGEVGACGPNHHTKITKINKRHILLYFHILKYY